MMAGQNPNQSNLGLLNCMGCVKYFDTPFFIEFGRLKNRIRKKKLNEQQKIINFGQI